MLQRPGQEAMFPELLRDDPRPTARDSRARQLQERLLLSDGVQCHGLRLGPASQGLP